MKKITGFAFHCHHDQLFEWVTDYQKRVDYIKFNKPEEEQELRLRLLKMIPHNKLPLELVKAWGTYSKAEEAYKKAWGTYSKAGKTYKKAEGTNNKAEGTNNKAEGTNNKAEGTNNKAEGTYSKAWETNNKAWEAYGKARGTCLPEITRLHEEVCPACPWDGQTIFPKEHKE